MIHAAVQIFRTEGLEGRRMEERINGMAGSRKRASWWGKMLRSATPDRADTRMGVMLERRRKKRSGNAGPSSCVRLTKKCW